jgi:uncharacterized protein (DUF1330 family)
MNNTELSCDQPIYVIFGGRIIDKARFRAYQQKAMPLAQGAGLKIVAAADNPSALEGRWPFKGSVVIERFASMRAFLDYRQSAAYQEALKLRELGLETEFTIVLNEAEAPNVKQKENP